MSVLAVDPAAPWYLKAAAEAILVLHIGGGGVGMVSGAVALVARKGGRVHGWTGKAFFGIKQEIAFPFGIGMIVDGKMLPVQRVEALDAD